MTGLLVAGGAIVAALVFGFYRRATDGRFASSGGRVPATEEPVYRDPATWHGLELGERATLVQFSSAFCAPCRTTRVILTDVASEQEGIVHHDIDAEAELALVRELKILRTPTR